LRDHGFAAVLDWVKLKDMHPMLVLSPRPFNERTSIVIGLPMTTAAYNETNPFAIKFQGPKEKVSYVLAHQPKSFDWRARNAKAHSQTPRRGRACLLLAINNSASDAPMCANRPIAGRCVRATGAQLIDQPRRSQGPKRCGGRRPQHLHVAIPLGQLLAACPTYLHKTAGFRQNHL
jgi:mRNA-degrading endonuclease toxin of MazEF toxin-antitoxin module